MLFGACCLFSGVLAYFAHQNNDDPANWFNWSTFRLIGMIEIVVLAVMAVAARLL
jgi:hypothetical protein